MNNLPGPGSYPNDPAAAAALAVKRKSVGMALLLAIFLPGWAQIYLGRIGTAFLIWFLYFVGVVTFVAGGFLLLLLVYFGGIALAVHEANQQNDAIVAAILGTPRFPGYPSRGDLPGGPPTN